MNRRGGASSNREAPSVRAAPGVPSSIGRFDPCPAHCGVSIAVSARASHTRMVQKTLIYRWSVLLYHCVEPRTPARRRDGGGYLDGNRSSAGRGSRPRPVDQRRAQLRRRLRRADRRHPAEHRGDRPRRPARAPEDRRALAADRLRVRPGGWGRRLPRVVLQGRPGRARPVRPGRRGVDPQRGHQEGGVLVRLREQSRHRPAHDHQRVARPPGPQGAGRAVRRHLRLLRRDPRHGRQPDRRHGRARLPGLGLEVQGRHPDRVRAGLPDPPRQPLRDHPLPALPGHRPGAR